MEKLRFYESKRIIASNEVMLYQGRLQILKEDLETKLSTNIIDKKKHDEILSALVYEFSEIMRRCIKKLTDENCTKVVAHHYDENCTQSYIVIFPVESEKGTTYLSFMDKGSDKYYIEKE